VGALHDRVDREDATVLAEVERIGPEAALGAAPVPEAAAIPARGDFDDLVPLVADRARGPSEDDGDGTPRSHLERVARTERVDADVVDRHHALEDLGASEGSRQRVHLGA
jgi:hypothetical protein